VRAWLAQRCAAQPPSVQKLAAELRISERSLTRRLARAGLHFRALLDDVRSERARALLDAGELSMTEVAQQLEFADATAFGRAFRRWHGVSPTDYRIALADGRAQLEHAED